ncbi:cytochrome P450 [Agrococcus sp. Marseille-P2731]|uniref:cytochrome P450 n=1 Tax=Agrococcus sp. Marseille-P2731 TaxID=1841862 RepID=UPI000931A507|nr:cytochrome P450 [Agrococcus sp. Marseille-P2731]
MTHSPTADDTIPFVLRGYDFTRSVWRRSRSATARAIPMRLLLDDGLLVRGREGVELFYDEARMRRHGAMPAFVQETLFGHGSVHSLDGAEHKHRKATFLDVAYEDEQVERLLPHLEREWRSEVEAWAAGGERSAYDAAVGALGRAIMRWAGLPGTAAAKTRWAAREAQIVDGFGVPYSPEFVLAVLNRHWCDRHARELIAAVRAGTVEAAEGSALHAWAWHRGPDGELLEPKLAGVELQNVLRPMIAVARFVAFAAKELHERPEWRARIAAETAERGSLTEGPLAVAFAQELRRTAPFVPMLPAETLTEVELDGERLPAGHRVFLDIQGTNHDQAAWDRPREFDPERFVGRDDWESIPEFIPHGGGHPATGHRCPGEKIAIAGLAAAVAALSDPRVRILGEGLDVNRRRLPTKPASGGRVRSASDPSSSTQSQAKCPFH